MSITVGCAQLAPYKAEIHKNLDRIAETIVQAVGQNVDLLLFSEAATSGYFLEGGVMECSLSSLDLLQRITDRVSGKITRSIDVVIGFYEQYSGELFNSAAYLEITPKACKLNSVYRKFFLPTYGVFDEDRFVARGKDLGLLATRFGTVGILICEDVWHSILPTLLALKGAEIFLIPSASPGRGFKGDVPENLDRYVRLMKAVCEEHGVFCVNCQLCGFEGGKGFVGGSSVIDPFGETLAQSPIVEEHLLVTTIEPSTIAVARAQTPLLSDLQSSWAEIRQMMDGIS